TVLPNGDVAAGGYFTTIEGVAASRVAIWDGSTWRALGVGLNGDAYALAGAPNGDLIAGGNFVQAGGAPAVRVARWNGSTWSPLGSGLGIVPALAVPPN